METSSMPSLIDNPQLKLASNFVIHTNKNVFLTGKAGTGKTTFLKTIIRSSPKRIVVVAPTGVAAINAGGVTIHSFFQMPFGPYIPDSKPEKPFSSNPADRQRQFMQKFGKEKIKLIKSIDLLVIDEISMVRADMLDFIDNVLRRYRNRFQPFGGVQLLMIGDLHQLAPIVKDDEWELLKKYYDNIFFFNSIALKQTQPVCIELKHIYRQTDEYFINILNSIRENKANKEVLDRLNKRYIPNFEPKEDEGFITLTTHNNTAQSINLIKLNALKEKSHFFKAEVEGEFPGYSFPTDERLELKVGAQVMFIKNDSSREKRYYNGKIGKIFSFEDDCIKVKCPDEDCLISVNQEVWENVKYSLNEATGEINENVTGSFKQYPLKTAWAITIHKSQGLTFDKAVIDAGMSFAHGQVYVALSRCRSIEGLVLKSPIPASSIKMDGNVNDFSESSRQNQPNETFLMQSKLEYQRSLLTDLFLFKDLQNYWARYKRITNENHISLLADFLEQIKEIDQRIEKDVFNVAEKFVGQLSQLISNGDLPEQSEIIKERIRKGAAYFKEKLETILLGYTKYIVIDIDNKTAKKDILEELEKLQKEVCVKIACLVECEKDFDTVKYLRVRSNTDINFRPEFAKLTTKDKSKPFEKEIEVSGGEKNDLYQALKFWRDNLAQEADVATYMVIPYRTLKILAEKIPTSMKELKLIPGIGKTKAKQFGEEILTIINDFCRANEINIGEISFDDEDEPKKKNSDKKAAKKDEVPSHQKTLDLFKDGKLVDEIARERGLTIATIESHLLQHVSTGEVSVYDLMDRKRVDRLVEYYSMNKKVRISEAREFFGEEFSFTELRYVWNHLIFKADF